MARENFILESYKALNEQRDRRENKRLSKILESQKAKETFKDNYYRLAEARDIEFAQHEKLVEAARDDALSTALKAIYISALEASTLTDNGIVLAESLVDNWINENGGATKILGKAKNKTYFLARLSEIVEEAARIAVMEAEKDEEEDETDEKEEKETSEKESEGKGSEEDSEGTDDKDKEKEDSTSGDDDSDSGDSKDDGGDDKEEDNSESDNSAEESDEDGDDTESDDENDTEFDDGDEDDSDIEDHSEELDMVEVDDEEDAIEDDDVRDVVGEPLDDDGKDSDDTIDGSDDKGQLMNDLEAEPDVQKAVELIRTRVADAEETFIKNNAKDKQEIDELVGKLSDSIKTVESLKDKDSREAKVAQEHVNRLYKDINMVHEGYVTDVFSNMARAINKGILKNKAVLEMYMGEDNKLDIDLVVETTKVMYGFMETLNTLQLVKVDEAYIEDAIKQMSK